jgi:hypothetical protein
VMKLPALPSLPLKRDPRQALAKARYDLTTAEATLAGLTLKRQTVLVESDELEPWPRSTPRSMSSTGPSVF